MKYRTKDLIIGCEGRKKTTRGKWVRGELVLRKGGKGRGEGLEDWKTRGWCNQGLENTKWKMEMKRVKNAFV